MGVDNLIFLENIEWFDKSGKELVHRIPETGSGEIKYGAQLTVRESQAAVFFYQGKAVGAFAAGRHTLKTGNIPILTKIASIPWALSSPLRAEIYFVNLKVFTNLKWGTRDPVAFKDTQLGLVRLRAFGAFNVQVVQPVLFINRMVGTQQMFTTEEIETYLSMVIVSRFNDFMGEKLDTILNLPARYDSLSEGISRNLEEDFSHFGLRLTHLYIGSITPPPEVQQAIDDRSRLSLFQDLNKLIQMKAAMSLEKAAQSESSSSEGLGLGMGLMMPAMFSHMFSGPRSDIHQTSCQECQNPIDAFSKFCPYCGHQQVIFSKCLHCNKNITPNAKFCPRCGKRVEDTPKPKVCPGCRKDNLYDSIFCNHCGEKL